jgi:trehalose/maltose hydrolase-like predicted phosphorylase
VGLQLVLRFNVFQLTQTVSFNTIGLDTSIPARGLHGESYRGHIFWDEVLLPPSFAGAALHAWPNRACERHQLFVFPSYNLRLPEVTRTLLLYRFYRLDAARDRAKQVLDTFTYIL